jgi:hypothetical protein
MRRRLAQLSLALLALLLVLAAFGYGFRDKLATALARVALERSSKLHCTHPAIHIAGNLSQIAISELECTMRDGPIRYVRTHSETTIELSHLRPLNVHIEKAVIDQRERDVSDVHTDALGEMAKVAGLSDTLFKGMLDFSELYSPTSPPVTIDELDMKRAGKREALLHGFRKSLDGHWDRCWAATVETPGVGSAVAVQALDMRVTPSHGRLSASVYFTRPKLGQEPDLAIHVEGRHLDERHPQFNVKL